MSCGEMKLKPGYSPETVARYLHWYPTLAMKGTRYCGTSVSMPWLK